MTPDVVGLGAFPLSDGASPLTDMVGPIDADQSLPGGGGLRRGGRYA